MAEHMTEIDAMSPRSGGSAGACAMHDHDVCEQLMAAANRTGNYGRLEYLTARCDATHATTADTDEHEEQA